MKNIRFTEGKILSPLIRFALPVLLAVFLQAMYGAIDLLMVGRFSTAADVSAVSTGSQIMQTITVGIVGLSMGTTILLGQKIGKKETQGAGDAVGASICLFAVIGALAAIVLLAAANPLTGIMKAPREAFDKTVAYVRISAAGSLFIVAYNVIGSIFRGMGNSTIPLLTVAIACGANITGDLLFVAVLHMAAAGAAIATVLAQAISVVLSVVLIKRQGLPFAFAPENIRFHKSAVKKVIRFGFPIAFQDILVSISFLAILSIVNSIGLTASAGVGVAEKLCAFIMLVPSAYMQSMSAFTAQNIGADKKGRANRALLYSILTSLAFGITTGYFSFFHGDGMARIFTSNPAVISAAADYLKAYAIDCVLVSFLFCFMGYFNGCGKTVFVMAQGITGAFGIRIPVSYLMSRLRPVSLFRVGLATPSSTSFQIVLCLIYFISINGKIGRRRSASEAKP